MGLDDLGAQAPTLTPALEKNSLPAQNSSGLAHIPHSEDGLGGPGWPDPGWLSFFCLDQTQAWLPGPESLPEARHQ